MPKYRVVVQSDPLGDIDGGEPQVWNLSWERLVFDQRLQYQAQGDDEAKIWRISKIDESAEGSVFHVIVDPGLRTGGDPKKDRPPYLTGTRD